LDTRAGQVHFAAYLVNPTSNYHGKGPDESSQHLSADLHAAWIKGRKGWIHTKFLC